VWDRTNKAAGKWFKQGGLAAVERVLWPDRGVWFLLLPVIVAAFYSSHNHDWRGLNAQLVARHRVDDVAALLSSARASHAQLVAFLQTVAAEEFGHDRGLRFRGCRVTIAGELKAEIKDEEQHNQPLRAFSDPSDEGNQNASDAESH